MPDQLLFIVMIAMLVVFMFFSSRRRKKAAEEMSKQLVKGAEVMLTSGIYGVIDGFENDRVQLVVGKNTIEVARGAVARVMPVVVTTKPVAKKPAAKKTTSTSSKK